MSIGVIRKWSIDPQRYPALAAYHRRSYSEPPLSSLQNTSGGVGIQSKKTRPPCNYCGGIKNISGEPCVVCGDEGYADSGPPITSLNLSEPMEIAFRLLKYCEIPEREREPWHPNEPPVPVPGMKEDPEKALYECDSCRATFNDYSQYQNHECGVPEERWP